MWKNIIDFEDTYEVSDLGVVRSKDRTCVDSLGRKRLRMGKVLNPDIAQNGYYRVTLAKNGTKVQKYLHRLIAEYFIPNPKNLPQVNHIDGNKVNCSIDNLEWVSIKENVVHAYKYGLINHVCGVEHPNYGKFGRNSKKAIRVKAINIATNKSKIYEAIIETKADGFLPSEVSRCAKHGGTHHGFVFELI